MSLNKIKYFGVCATALLTIAPVATNMVTFTAQQASTVSAATDPARYQDSMSVGFVSGISLRMDQINSLNNGAISGDPINNGFSYTNFGSSRGSLFGVNPAPSSGSSLQSSLQDVFLKLFVNAGATVGDLVGDPGYTTTMRVTGPKITTPITSSADLIGKLKTLVAGDTFSVSLTTTNSGGTVVGSKSISVNVSSVQTKKTIVAPAAVNVNNGDAYTTIENQAANKEAIKDSTGASSLTPTSGYRYALNGSDTFVTKTGIIKLSDFNSNATSGIITQLIPITYSTDVANNYEASSFVFLDSNGKVTSTPQATAYIKRQINVGNVDAAAYPVFKYTKSGSNPVVLKNGDTFSPDKEDQAKLTFKYDDSTSIVELETFLKGAFQNSFSAYDSAESTNKIPTITYKLPDRKPSSSPQYVMASVTSSTTGKISSIKIPVTVTGLPNTTTAPTITVFPDAAVSVSSKTMKSIDPITGIGVRATYVGKDGKTSVVPKNNTKVTVKDSSGNIVNLNSDGTIPTDKNGVYTVTYVFANPEDLIKEVTRSLTLSVGDTVLNAPTVNGFVEGTYDFSNVSRKFISPFDAALKTNQIDATYVDKNGKTQKIDNSKIKVTVTDSANKEVALNTDGTIPLTNAGVYRITYTFVNGDDATQKVSKNVTLNVNSLKTEAPVPVYADGVSQNSSGKTDIKSFDPMAGLKFNYTYGDSKQTTEQVPASYISVSVTKDGQPLKLNADGTFATEVGSYAINYRVVNPKDNGTVLNYTRTLTISADQPKPTEPAVTSEKGVIYIKYVPGYGVNLWNNYNTKDGAVKLANGTNRKMMHGTAWKYSAVAKYADGSTWYKLGTNQWIQGEYTSTTPVESWTITNKTGVGKVHYKPGYGINVWTSPDAKKFTKKVKHGTSWKYFKIAKKGSKTMYNLGGNQWIDGAYFK